ncbi:MAG: hypothetical protein WCS91_02145 [Bacilli bacterium]|jgi:hypothetical protein
MEEQPYSCLEALGLLKRGVPLVLLGKKRQSLFCFLEEKDKIAVKTPFYGLLLSIPDFLSLYRDSFFLEAEKEGEN